MSGLPKQVEQQLREVEEIERQLAPPAEPPAEPPPVEQAPPAVAVEPPQNVVEIPAEKPVDWEHKYRTLQGILDKQVKQDKGLAAEVQMLKEQILALQRPPEAAPVVEQFVTEQDEKDFGADLLDVQRRVAKEVMRDLVRPLQDELKQKDAKIASLEQQVQKTGGDVTTMNFEQRLASAVPDFQALNNDPKWIGWLDELDEYTGEPRRAYAEYVYSIGDVGKVKQVVDFFKKTTGQSQQQATNEQRQAELTRQVQPTRTASGSSSPPMVEWYTEAEAGRIFEKVRQLNMMAKYDEANALEAKITVAYQEGRVR